MTPNLKKVKEACARVHNPGAVDQVVEDIAVQGCYGIADVLLMARRSSEEALAVDTEGRLWTNSGRVEPAWNLLDDNVEKQSEETIAFLAELLYEP